MIVREADGVVRVKLQRPDKGNALSSETVAGLADAVAAATRSHARLFVIEGEGRHFCTGFDLSNVAEEDDDRLLARFVRVELLLQAVHAAPFETLALAHGRTMGAGADLFCACNHRWVAGDASFAFPGAAFGIVLGTARLGDTVGARRARQWVESGATIDTAEALEAGLATRRIEPAEAEAGIAALASRCKRLDDDTTAGLQRALDRVRRPRGDAGAGEDLMQLVVSAARPGLRARIAAYRASLSANPSPRK
ncbi:enoyl-CoA hydratase/isomerase family protein [Ramlibacter sp.]|uniref:enoyl-CoA hydratase/isomerase family protein n=1 Tax=Ramlibacter sp. TaxID=1917967 RepID=UPI003D149235